MKTLIFSLVLAVSAGAGAAPGGALTGQNYRQLAGTAQVDLAKAYAGQVPGNEKQIREFCRLTYGVKFPMFEKVHVKGRDATPLYRRLAAATGEAPAWNFHKYLIDRKGRVVASFGSRTAPDDPALLAQVERLLSAPRPAP